MHMLEQLITSFIASAAFGVLFNSPKESLIRCGIVGMAGWFVYYVLVAQNMSSVFATLAASLLVAVISQIFAKTFKMPVIIFSVSGIIPLVPGGLAYDAMRNFIENDYNMAIQLATKVLLLAGAIAMGLIFSEVINQVYRKVKKMA
jgi:uncharacterized membrane protein YjjB (DUF3815 family)